MPFVLNTSVVEEVDRADFVHEALAMPTNMIREPCAVSLTAGHPLTSLTNDYPRRLAAAPEILTVPNGDLVGPPSIELVRAVIAPPPRAVNSAAEPLAATLQLRI